MFDHVKFGVSDYAASKAFFLKALEPLGVAVVSEGPPTYGVELSPKGKASLCLFQTEEKPAHLHLAFTAENRQQVEAFYRAALEAGGKDNGAPGLRPHYMLGAGASAGCTASNRGSTGAKGGKLSNRIGAQVKPIGNAPAWHWVLAEAPLEDCPATPMSGHENSSGSLRARSRWL